MIESNRAAHLHRGALAPPGPAEAQGEDRGEALEERHPAADVPASRMERFDDRIGAPTAGLGGGPRHQARRERAECRQEPDEPPPERALSGVSRDALARGAERHVPAETLEHDLLNHLDAQEEERSDESRGGADERGPEQGASKQLHRDGATRRQDRPSQYRPHPGRVAARVVAAVGWGRRHRETPDDRGRQPIARAPLGPTRPVESASASSIVVGNPDAAPDWRRGNPCRFNPVGRNDSPDVWASMAPALPRHSIAPDARGGERRVRGLPASVCASLDGDTAAPSPSPRIPGQSTVATTSFLDGGPSA